MKLLLLAIDAGDPALLRGWASDGSLPTIRTLLSHGLVADIEGIEGLYGGATWPSFYTGAGPARHGFHNWAGLRTGSYEYERVLPGRGHLSFGAGSPEPFWDTLSREGWRVAVLDVPLVSPSPGLNGIQVIEWGTHDAAFGLVTRPEQLGGDILRSAGRYPAAASCDLIGRSSRHFTALRERLLAGVEKKRDLTLRLLASEDWDLFIQVFTEAHCIGHQCWHLHDPSHPDHDPSVSARLGDPVRDVYRAIDAAIGRIVAAAAPDTTIALLATHGMAHTTGADLLLDDILATLGVLVPAQRPPGPGIARTVFRHLPFGLRSRLRPGIRMARRLRGLPPDGILPAISSRFDMSGSRCFPQLNGSMVSGIRVNLRGREPQGIVGPGAQMDELCASLTEDLLELRDAETGRPIVKRVIRTSGLFHGERAGDLPDLLVEWNDEIRVGSKALHDAGGRTGEHRPEGLFVVSGPGIEPSHLAHPVSIMDLAPTILTWFGAPLPDAMEGTPFRG